MLNTPVLFLIFNRPDLTEQVFAKIKQAKPRKLFIAADGPRADRDSEAALCEKTRSCVLDNIDWDCEVKMLFREKNLGCKLAVSMAITWFFEHVEQGIILEDDTLPDVSFFSFCEEMLEKFKHDEQVTEVCGFNYRDKYTEDGKSYFFSKIGSIWGWATWRRAWVNYDLEIKAWGDKKVKQNILNFLGSKDWFSRAGVFFDIVYNGKYDTWDYQWFFTQLYLNGVSVVPAVNLIENLGFRQDATHTTGNNDALQIKAHQIKAPFIGPASISNNVEYENYGFGLLPSPNNDSLIKKVYLKVKRKVNGFR